MKRTIARHVAWSLLIIDILLGVALVASDVNDPNGWLAAFIFSVPIALALFVAARKLAPRPARAMPVRVATSAFAIAGASSTGVITTYTPLRQRGERPWQRLTLGIAVIGGIVLVRVALGSAISAAWTALDLSGTNTARTKALPAAQALGRSLVAAPLSAQELPAGFTGPRVTSVDGADLPRKLVDRHAISGAGIALNEPDALDYVRYYVFPLKQDAHDAYDHLIATPSDNAKLGSSTSVKGFDGPARCTNFTWTDAQHEPNSGTTCYTVVGTVRVSGTAAGPGQANHQADALTLTRLGVDHLTRVTSQAAQ